MITCFNCSGKIELLGVIPRGEECPHCGADLKVCRNCKFYDPQFYNECQESSAERVLDKERSNFCDHFSPRGEKNLSSSFKKEDLKEKAESLFRSAKPKKKD